MKTTFKECKICGKWYIKSNLGNYCSKKCAEQIKNRKPKLSYGEYVKMAVMKGQLPSYYLK
jgi:hypothetical protein